MGIPFSSLISCHSLVGSSTKMIESSLLFFFFEAMYSCNLDLPVVFPDPIFPSIDAIKQPDVAADDADDDDDDDVFMHLDNEAVAPIFNR